MEITIGTDREQSEQTERQNGSHDDIRRSTRRLSDKVLIAFHQACDQDDFEVAERLLHVLEMMLKRRPLALDRRRRRDMGTLVAAHERLWQLRHPDEELLAAAKGE